MSILSRARHAYILHPTRRGLRTYLIHKAKRGKFDKRMFRYYRIDPRVNEACRRAVVRAYARGLVPTSTTGGTHAPGSWHYRRNAKGEGQAVDVGLIESEIGTARGLWRMMMHQANEHERHRHGKAPTMQELLGPDNKLAILRAHETDLVEGTPLETMHDNHVHHAFAG